MELQVLNVKGAATGKKVNLDEAVFGIEPNDQSIYLDVKQYLANQRQGTHSAKEKSQLSGSTRKLKKQKGSGSARYGSIKSPLFRGGARIFGPRPRDYSFKVNAKVKQLARKSALSYKMKDNEILVVEDFNILAPKTKEIVQIATNLKVIDKKILFIVPEPNKGIYLSSRNLPNVEVITASDLNTYRILWAKNLVFLESSIGKVVDVLKK